MRTVTGMNWIERGEDFAGGGLTAAWEDSCSRLG